MTTWGYSPEVHPWFRMPSLKRKGLDDDDISIVEYTARPYVQPCSKRRKCDVLEHGLARLSLNTSVDGSVAPFQSAVKHVPDGVPHISVLSPSSMSTSQPPTTWGTSSLPYTETDLAPVSVVLPSSIEEPALTERDEDLLDIQMKSPSWYEVEKDRIVITDLEGFAAEDEQPTSPTERGDVAISSTLLDRLKTQASLPTPDFTESSRSKALILFKPLVIPENAADAQRLSEQEANAAVEEVEDGSTTDTDAPMDVDEAVDIEPL